MNAMYHHSSLFMMVQGGVELTGYLMKMSRRLHSWRQLWCVLKGAQLFYYSSEVTVLCANCQWYSKDISYRI